MKLNAIFAKDVQRPIEGVIKADDTAHLGIEVDDALEMAEQTEV